jgi:hypothetical protein
MSDPFQLAVMLALMLVSIGGGIAIGIVAGRRSGIAAALAAGLTWLVGMGSTGMAFAHLAGVLYTATNRGDYTYNFRFASLLLVGILIVVAGLLCIAAVPGLVQRRRPAWGRAVSGTLLLLIVCAPLSPVQPDLAGVLTQLGILLLVVLLTARRWLVPGPTIAPAV